MWILCSNPCQSRGKTCMYYITGYRNGTNTNLGAESVSARPAIDSTWPQFRVIKQRHSQCDAHEIGPPKIQLSSKKTWKGQSIESARAFVTPILNPSPSTCICSGLTANSPFLRENCGEANQAACRKERKREKENRTRARLTQLDPRMQRVNPENSACDRSPPTVIHPYLSYSPSYRQWPYFPAEVLPRNPISDFCTTCIYIAEGRSGYRIDINNRMSEIYVKSL